MADDTISPELLRELIDITDGAGGGRLTGQMRFIVEIERLSSVLRKTLLANGSRLENDAEHSWRLAVIALLFREYAPAPIFPRAENRRSLSRKSYQGCCLTSYEHKSVSCRKNKSTEKPRSLCSAFLYARTSRSTFLCQPQLHHLFDFIL